jgi:hypothetical protein
MEFRNWVVSRRETRLMNMHIFPKSSTVEKKKNLCVSVVCVEELLTGFKRHKSQIKVIHTIDQLFRAALYLTVLVFIVILVRFRNPPFDTQY